MASNEYLYLVSLLLIYIARCSYKLSLVLCIELMDIVQD